MDLPAAYFILRVSVGLICILAALEKLPHPRDFIQGVGEYQLVPARLVGLVAGAILVSELVAGLSLSTGIAVGLGAAFAVLLFFTFSVALAVNLIQGRRIPCHCFGHGVEERVSMISLTRAAVLASTSVAVLVLRTRRPPLPLSRSLLPSITIAIGMVLLATIVGL